MRRLAAVYLLVCVLLGVSACRGAEREASPAAEAAAQPPAYPFVEIEPPVVPFDEFRLPQRYHLSDYSSRYAVLIDNEANQGLCALEMLDMESGATWTALPAPLGRADGFITLTARCSDSWIAWEEYGGDEQADPWNVQWRLYAAPLTPNAPVGVQPVLVAESTTSIRSRPLFQVVDDRVYWMTNSSPNPEQEGAVCASYVEVRDLATGTKDVVFVTSRFIRTFCVQDDALIMSFFKGRDTWQEEVAVVGLYDGEERFDVALENGEAQVSHWPAYSDGTLLWGELYSTVKSAPRLRLITASGDRHQLADAGSDPLFVGSRVVYESFATQAPAGLQWPTINVLDIATREHYVLVQTSGSMNDISWMLIPGKPRSDSVLVVTGTVWGEEGTGEVGCWIRRYRL